MKHFYDRTKPLFVCVLILFLFTIAGCKSVKTDDSKGQGIEVQNNVTTLTKYPDAMLWRLDGFSKTGEASIVYLLGTYHAGDERMLPFPECVQSAIDSSDRFVCELSQKDWNNMGQLMTDLTMQGFLKDLSHTFIDDLTQEEIILVSRFIDQQTLAQLVCFEPWVLNNSLQQVLILASELDTQKACDIMIMEQLAKRNMSFEGLDTAQTQLDLIAWGDWDTQLVMLRDTLHDLEDLAAAAKEMNDLYEVYLSGDEKAFEQAYYKDLEKEVLTNPVYEEYIKALLDDRNEAWADKINGYLEQGGTTFIFAGCAHFTGKASVFEYLKKNGTL